MIPFANKSKLKTATLLAVATFVAGVNYAQANDSTAGFINSNRLHLPINSSMEAPSKPNAATQQRGYAPNTQNTTSENTRRTSRSSNNNSQSKNAINQQEEQRNADQLLIQGLANSGDFDQIIRDQVGDGLSPEEIRRFKDAFLEYEAAKNNPEPPPTRSDIKQLSAGDTIELVVMNDFPSTLMLADQFGEPLAIDYHDLGADSVVEVREMRSQKIRGEEKVDIVDGLRIHALQPMRSTSLTIRAEGSRLPINITIRTIPADGKTSVVVLNEVRLSWVNKLSQNAVSAGRYAAPDIRKRGDKMMLDVVTGTLLEDSDKGIHRVKLEGEINSALFVDEATGFWYLRLPIDATPQNVAIESQALSSINGYRVIRMKSVPPRVIGITANGRSYRLVMHLDRRLSNVQ